MDWPSPSVNGYRLLRWIGEPSPWDDPEIVRDIVEQRIPQWAIDQFREYDRYKKMTPSPKRSDWIFGPDHGFSRHYAFGPLQFACWMLEADAEILMTNEWDRWGFIDVTDEPERTERRRPLTRNEWRQLMASFAKLNRRRRLRPEFR